jgi:SdpI/YhfL family protein
MRRVLLFVPLLIIVLSIPMILRKVPRNSLYGFRTAYTLSSDEVWYRANKNLASRCSSLACFGLSPGTPYPRGWERRRRHFCWCSCWDWRRWVWRWPYQRGSHTAGSRLAGQAGCTETGGAVTGRHGAIGLARARKDADVVRNGTGL